MTRQIDIAAAEAAHAALRRALAEKGLKPVTPRTLLADVRQRPTFDPDLLMDVTLDQVCSLVSRARSEMSRGFRDRGLDLLRDAANRLNETADEIEGTS